MGRRAPSSYQLHLLGGTYANGLLPSQYRLKQQHPGPSLNLMQRINYENLSQVPSALRWSRPTPTPCRERPQPPRGSWEVRLSGGARAESKSRNCQDQATQMKLRMSYTMDTETEPYGPTSASFNVSCRCSVACIYSLNSSKGHLFIPLRKETLVGDFPLCASLLSPTSLECVCHTCPCPWPGLWHMSWCAQIQVCP